MILLTWSNKAWFFKSSSLKIRVVVVIYKLYPEERDPDFPSAPAFLEYITQYGILHKVFLTAELIPTFFRTSSEPKHLISMKVGKYEE